MRLWANPLIRWNVLNRIGFQLSVRDAAKAIIHKHRGESSDFFTALAMMIKDEASKRQPRQQQSAFDE